MSVLRPIGSRTVLPVQSINQSVELLLRLLTIFIHPIWPSLWRKLKLRLSTNVLLPQHTTSRWFECIFTYIAQYLVCETTRHQQSPIVQIFRISSIQLVATVGNGVHQTGESPLHCRLFSDFDNSVWAGTILIPRVIYVLPLTKKFAKFSLYVLLKYLELSLNTTILVLDTLIFNFS